VPARGSPRTPLACQRRSKNTDTQIDASKSARMGSAWSAIETKSTPGRSTTAINAIPTPIRRFLLSRWDERMPSRTRPRMKMGSSKRTPKPAMTAAAKEK